MWRDKLIHWRLNGNIYRYILSVIILKQNHNNKVISKARGPRINLKSKTFLLHYVNLLFHILLQCRPIYRNFTIPCFAIQLEWKLIKFVTYPLLHFSISNNCFNTLQNTFVSSIISIVIMVITNILKYTVFFKSRKAIWGIPAKIQLRNFVFPSV
jgi:hypothetical protein